MLKRLSQALSTPWLLRKLVHAQTRQAAALERLALAASLLAGLPATIGEAGSEDDDDEAVTVATDATSYEFEQQDRRRARR